jgi:hypothetical protein
MYTTEKMLIQIAAVKIGLMCCTICVLYSDSNLLEYLEYLTSMTP